MPGTILNMMTSLPFPGKTIMPATAASASAATVVTSLDSITRDWDLRNDPQVELGLSWMLDNQTTPTLFKTNLPSARFGIRVTGVKSILLPFADVYSHMNANGAFMTPRVGTVAFRCWDEAGATPPWTFGVRPTLSSGGALAVHGLDPAKTYRYEFETNTVSDAVGLTARWETSRLPGDSGVTGNELAQIWQVGGIITNGIPTFLPIHDARTPLKVLILGDSNTGGWISPTGDPNLDIDVYAARSLFIDGNPNSPRALWDKRGAMVQYIRLVLEDWCARNNRRLVLLNRSHGGSWQGAMHATQRAVWASLCPGIFLDPRDTIGYRTDLSNSTYVAGSDWTGNPTFDLVIATSFANDVIQCGQAIAMGGGVTNSFTGNALRDSVGANGSSSLIKNIHTNSKMSGAKVLLIQSQFQGGIAENVRTAVRAAIGLPSYSAAHYGSQFGQTDYSWLGYIDLKDYASQAGWVTDISNIFGIHPLYDRHAAMQPLLQVPFDAFMAR